MILKERHITQIKKIIVPSYITKNKLSYFYVDIILNSINEKQEMYEKELLLARMQVH